MDLTHRAASNIVQLRLHRLNLILAGTAILAGSPAWAQSADGVTAATAGDIPVWLATTHFQSLEKTRNAGDPNALDVPANPIRLDASSSELKLLAVQLANAAFPCTAFALLNLKPASAVQDAHRRDSLPGLPSAATVALVAQGAAPRKVDQSLIWIWDGPYAPTGGLHVDIDTTTVPAGNDTYLSSVSARVVDVDGVPIPNVPALEPRFRFLWTARDGRLFGVFRSPD